MTLDTKEKSAEWRASLPPFENKELIDAAKNIGIPAHRKQVIMSMSFDLFKKAYGKK